MPPPLSRADAAHFLRRVGFGARVDEIDRLVGTTREAAIEGALDFRQATPAIVPPIVETTTNAYESWFALLYAWYERLITTGAPLREKLLLFWHGHFATQFEKVLDGRLMWDQHAVMHELAAGSFLQLCRRVSLGPAMLVFLDNATNVRGRPQENFARELMELHTLGVGNFTEADVDAMARAWTGHGVAPQADRAARIVYRFDASAHDSGVKTIFSIPRAWNGPDTIDEIVAGSRQQACAEFIARKLAKAFVSPQPSAALVSAAAREFATSGMQIGALMRTLFNAEEFWSPANRFAVVKNPIEFTASFLRLTGLPLRDSGLHFSLHSMGQVPFGPPDVAGWGSGDYWLTTASAWGRGQWLNYVRWGTAPHGFLSGLGTMSSRAAAQRMAEAFGMVDVSARTLGLFEQWHAAMLRNDAGWATDADAVVVAGMSPEFNLA